MQGISTFSNLFVHGIEVIYKRKTKDHENEKNNNP